MDEPFLGEIQFVAFNYAPRGWAFCNGQLLPINQNQALFSLLGTMYGGNGQTTFALPDLRGRVPLGYSGADPQGSAGGAEAVTLSSIHLPPHLHTFAVSERPASSTSPTGKHLASGTRTYGGPAANTALAADSVTNAGGSQAHTNMQPYLTLQAVIALQGIFPSRN